MKFINMPLSEKEKRMVAECNQPKGMEEMTPQQGDRIIVKNVPENYKYKDHYAEEGIIDKTWNGTAVGEDGRVCFFTGYVPYRDEDKISISGGGHSVNINKLRYIETKPGTFWRFKNGIRRAHNGEEYREPVQYFETDFADVN